MGSSLPEEGTNESLVCPVTVTGFTESMKNTDSVSANVGMYQFDLLASRSLPSPGLVWECVTPKEHGDIEGCWQYHTSR